MEKNCGPEAVEPPPQTLGGIEGCGAVLARISRLDISFAIAPADSGAIHTGRLLASGRPVMNAGETYRLRLDDNRSADVRADSIISLPGGGFVALFTWLEQLH